MIQIIHSLDIGMVGAENKTKCDIKWMVYKYNGA